jgi:hypothetical protein
VESAVARGGGVRGGDGGGGEGPVRMVVRASEEPGVRAAEREETDEKAVGEAGGADVSDRGRGRECLNPKP